MHHVMSLSCSVTEIVTSSPVGMQLTPLRQDALQGIFYRNITWYPRQYQVGQQLFCFKAKDSAGYLSWYFFWNVHSKEIINFESNCFIVPRNNIICTETVESLLSWDIMWSWSYQYHCEVKGGKVDATYEICIPVQLLSCSFEKMIDRKNRLKTLKLKNVAECDRYLLGPRGCFHYWLLYFCNNAVHKSNAGLRAHICTMAGHEFPLEILTVQFERTYLLFL